MVSFATNVIASFLPLTILGVYYENDSCFLALMEAASS